jgi:iron complex transport system substrate-binding protein
LVSQNPDLVFLADTKCCGQSVKTFGARPGFGNLAAVRSGSVVELDDDLASRWGPRTPDFLEMVVDAVTKHAALATSGR